MASSKVMATTSTTNPDMPRQPAICSSLSSVFPDLQTLAQDPNQPSDIINSQSSLTMDDLFKTMYSSPPSDPAPTTPLPGSSELREGSFSLPRDVVDGKSVEEVWKEIVVGGGDQRRAGVGEGMEGITLEDFLTKAGAVGEEDVRAVGGPVQVGAGAGAYGVDAGIGTNTDNNNNNNSNGQFRQQGFGNGGGMIVMDGAVRGGRGKRRAIEEPPVDKATQQKQRRMIKNRESAARSRERKQAYTVELESLVTRLEEENARLLREAAEENKERLKQLMENLIPVVEKRRPTACVLRRVQSMKW